MEELVYKIRGRKLIYSKGDSSRRRGKAWELVASETPL